MVLSYTIHIKPLDNKEREIYIYTYTRKYEIQYIIHKDTYTILAPILPYITWGLIQDPQNKRRNTREEY